MSGQSLLLHICCGPCALYPVARLREKGFQVVGLFSNPNIQPLQEYLRRREAVLQAADALDLRVIIKDEDYDPQVYMRHIAFREERRCFFCYQLRLERTVSIARRGGFDCFSTTLLYSKRQRHEDIAAAGRNAAGGGQVGFYYEDLRIGWRQGIEQAKSLGLYRQEYCGCLLSEFERFRKAL
jgi:hypothetical protein